MRKHPKALLCLIVIIFYSTNLLSTEPIKLTKNFTFFTEKNMQGYFKPLITSLGESMNSNLFTRALYPNYWSIGLDISIMGMFIPEDQRQFDAELPIAYGNTNIVKNALLIDGTIIKDVGGTYKQPTVYGGPSTTIFAAPQNKYASSTSYNCRQVYDSTYKSAYFAEGNDISFMAGLPAIQLIGGFPTRTELRLRFLTIPVQNEMMIYWAVILKQQFDHFFNLFDPADHIGLALHFAYHSMNRDPGFSLSSFAVGFHASKAWDFGLTAYGGFQLEGLSGEFKAEREKASVFDFDAMNNPYPEVRAGGPLSFDLESFNSYRLLGGLSYRTGIIELHADAALAAQPILNIGLTFWFGEWGKKEVTTESIERYEKIERYERIKKNN